MTTTPANFTIVIQARVGSTRLPNKVCLPLGDSNVLEQMVRRVKKSRLANRIIIATTLETADDRIVEMAERAEVECFRGHTTDCLDRHYGAWIQFGGSHVVKIPSDCPLIDPQVIDLVLGEALKADADYVSNLHPQSFPDGNDVEVMKASALQQAWKESTRPIDREHTTTYLWDHPEKFKLANVLTPDGKDYSKSFRWTIDYREDYLLIKTVFEALSVKKPNFGWSDIVKFLETTPSARSLNALYLGDSWYQRHAQDLNHPIEGAPTNG